jgi:hypothetical protein
MANGIAPGYGLGLGTQSSRAGASPPDAPHKSCTGNTLRLEYSSPTRSADLLAEADVTTWQLDRERTAKQGQFIFCGHLSVSPFQYLIGAWLKFQLIIQFPGREQRVRIYQTLLEINFSEHPLRIVFADSIVPWNRPG